MYARGLLILFLSTDVIFQNRHHAAALLAQKLSAYRDTSSVVVGLARGGVVIASGICALLAIPLDVLVVKKIPSPTDAELALGAVAPDGVSFIDWKVTHGTGADEAYIKSQITKLSSHIDRTTDIYRSGKRPLAIKNRTVILVDDGAATGATMHAAIRWCRKKHVRRLVVGLPVVAPDTLANIKPEVDTLVFLESPQDFASVGQFYKEFPQVEDHEVVELLSTQEDSKIERPV